jgi:polysaccharide biosynthesis protein VpsM
VRRTPRLHYFKKIVFIFIGGVVGGLLLLPDTAWPAGNLRLGSLEIHPSVSVTATLDDNVCRTESKECFIDKNGNEVVDPDEIEDGRDFITIVSPGLRLVLPIRDHELQTEYHGEFARHSEFDSEDYEDHAVRGSLDLNFPRGLSIRAEESWIDGHDQRGTAQNVDLDFYKRNTATASVQFPLGSRFGLRVNYTHFILDYEEDRNDFRNHTDNTIGGTVFFHVGPRTSLLAEYSNTAVTFDEDVDPVSGLSRDSDVQRVLSGVSYKITAKTKGTVKAGFEKKKFDESARKDFSGGTVSVELDHELTPRTLLQASAERGSRESNLESEDFYVLTGGQIGVTHAFTGKLSGDARVSFGRERYPDKSGVEGRTDNTRRFRLDLDYWIQKWLNAEVRYEHGSRSSNNSKLGFKDNLYSASLGLFF